MKITDIKPTTNFKGFVSALRRVGRATATTAVLLCCSWYSVAMAQAGDGSSAPQVRVRLFLEAPLRTPPAPLAVRVQHVDSVLQLMSDEADDVTVIIEALNTAAELMLTVSVDDAEVVSVPSAPIAIVAAGDAIQRSTQIKLTGKDAGEALVTLVVTDNFGNRDETQLRVVVLKLIQIVSPAEGTAYNLLSDEADDVTVIIEALNTAAELTLTVSVDDDEVVSVPSAPIAIAAAGDAIQRSTQIKLTGKDLGEALVTLVVTDNFGNRDETQLRVVVLKPVLKPIQIVSPAEGTAYNLLSDKVDDVTVIIEAFNTAAALALTVSVDDAEVVSVPNAPIVIVAAGDAIQRSTQIKLTGRDLGEALVTLVVTDNFGNRDETQLRVVVLKPIRIVSPAEGIAYNLLSDKVDDVTVIIEAFNTAAALALTVSVDDAEVVSVPSAPIVIVAAGDAIQRSTQIKLTGKDPGEALVTLVATDNFGNRDETQLRVVVLEPIRIVSPVEGTRYNLMSDKTGDVTVVIEVPNVAAELTLTVSVDDAEVVSVPSAPIAVAAVGDAIQRSTQFKLTGQDPGEALVTLVATDNFGNRDETQLRVVVAECSGDCLPEMVVVPAGSFVMGSPDDDEMAFSWEMPQHRVTVSSFAVGKYELTRGQFAAFVAATGYDAGSGRYSWRDPGFEQSDSHPVVNVSWNDAKAYIRWLSAQTGHQYRLLSEAEWEYAARAGTTTRYHFGNTISPSQANYDGNNGGTVAVGSYAANKFGLHDMHGNVWEWVEDCLHDDYVGAPRNGSAWVSNCEDFGEDYSRVLRGGSWGSRPWLLRSAIRNGLDTRDRFNSLGFRVARTL